MFYYFCILKHIKCTTYIIIINREDIIHRKIIYFLQKLCAYSTVVARPEKNIYIFCISS